MQSRISLRLLFGLVAVVAVALAIWQQRRQALDVQRLRRDNERLAEEVERLKFDLELARIDTLLKVPTEALYQDYKLRGELDRVRWAAMEERAPDDFVPLYGLYEHWPGSPRPYYFRAGRGARNWKNSQDSFWEGYAINHADDGLQLLNGKLKGSEEFRRRLMTDLPLRDEYLKPLLLRFLRSTDQQCRLAAVEALLLLDDPRPEVLEVIRNDLRWLSAEPPRAADGDAVLSPEYAKSLAGRYRALIEEHNLASKVAEADQDEGSPAKTPGSE